MFTKLSNIHDHCTKLHTVIYFVPHGSCSVILFNIANQGDVGWNSLPLNVICLQSFTKFKISIDLMISQKYLL